MVAAAWHRWQKSRLPAVSAAASGKGRSAQGVEQDGRGHCAADQAPWNRAAVRPVLPFDRDEGREIRRFLRQLFGELEACARSTASESTE
jgi:hypothetical protein